MDLFDLKKHLQSTQELQFLLPNLEKVPQHFHITELGINSKHFIDCGGRVRKESFISFQLWYSVDTDHRLAPSKMLDIINIAEKEIGLEDLEVKIEYQSDSIATYGLEHRDGVFVLSPTHTACLAMDNCGIPEKAKKTLASLSPENACAPRSGCC